MDKYSEYLKTKAQDFNIDLNESQIDQFRIFYKLLDEYNSHTNVVSSSEKDLVYKKHFVDSLALGLVKGKLNPAVPSRVIDIGIGGGFPGIPLLIAYENLNLCAVDSVGKKTKFIELLVKELGFSTRVEVLNARAEEIAFDPDKRHQFDFAVTRAVAHLSIISEYCLPFVKKGGFFIPYKSKTANNEINEAKKALSQLGGNISDFIQYEISEEQDVERNLILIEKIKDTSNKYPRNTGIPKKNPL